MRLHKAAAVSLSILIAFTFAACGSPARTSTPEPTASAEPDTAAVEPATYTAVGSGHEEGLAVTIEVLNGTVVGCTIDASHETPGVGGLAAPKLQTQIEDGAMPDEIDSVAGATETCNGIIGLYKDCLTQAGIDY